MMFRTKYRGGKVRPVPTAVPLLAQDQVMPSGPSLSGILIPALGAIVPLLVAGAPFLGKKIISSMGKKDIPELTNKEQAIITKEIDKLTKDLLVPAPVNVSKKSIKSKRKRKAGRAIESLPITEASRMIGIPLCPDNKPMDGQKKQLRGLSIAQMESKLGMGIIEY